MKIFAVNNFNFNNINFESKKSKNIQTPAHQSTPLKAIPVALLMAMSPLNTPITMAQAPSTEMSYTQPEENEIVAQFIFNKATPEGEPAIVTVRSTDNNNKIVELHLNKKINSYAIDVNNNVVDAYRIREIKIVPEKLYSKVEAKNYANNAQKVVAKYYVTGSGTEYTNPPKSLDKNVTLNNDAEPIISDVKNRSYEISKDLYTHLKKMLKNKIEINEEHTSTFILDSHKKH